MVVETMRGRKQFDSVVVNHKLVTVGKDTAKRFCSCGKCDKAISKGENRYMVVTSSDCKVYHENCYNDLVEAVADTDTVASNYSANSTIDHEVVVIADKKLAGWFYSRGFVARKHNPTHRKYVLDCECNRHRSGHLIKTLLDNDFKVLVNGEEVASWEDFEKVTR